MGHFLWGVGLLVDFILLILVSLVGHFLELENSIKHLLLKGISQKQDKIFFEYEKKWCQFNFWLIRVLFWGHFFGDLFGGCLLIRV